MTALALDPLGETSADPSAGPPARSPLLAAARGVGWLALLSATVAAAAVCGMALSVLFAAGTVIVAAIALVCVVVVAAVVAALAVVLAALLVVGGALPLVVAAIASALGIALAFGAGMGHGARSLWTMLERMGRRPVYWMSSSG